MYPPLCLALKGSRARLCSVTLLVCVGVVSLCVFVGMSDSSTSSNISLGDIQMRDLSQMQERVVHFLDLASRNLEKARTHAVKLDTSILEAKRGRHAKKHKKKEKQDTKKRRSTSSGVDVKKEKGKDDSGEDKGPDGGDVSKETKGIGVTVAA
jgi:hypothetical protein